jgi:hypothetical protein
VNANSPWEFATAGRIIFGAGARHQLPALVRGFGTRALLVSGRHLQTEATLPDLNDIIPLVVHGEPTLDVVRRGAELFRAAACSTRRRRSRRSSPIAATCSTISR